MFPLLLGAAPVILQFVRPEVCKDVLHGGNDFTRDACIALLAALGRTVACFHLLIRPWLIECLGAHRFIFCSGDKGGNVFQRFLETCNIRQAVERVGFFESVTVAVGSRHVDVEKRSAFAVVAPYGDADGADAFAIGGPGRLGVISFHGSSLFFFHGSLSPVSTGFELNRTVAEHCIEGCHGVVRNGVFGNLTDWIASANARQACCHDLLIFEDGLLIGCVTKLNRDRRR